MSSILKALKKVEKGEGVLKVRTSPVSREILDGITRPEKKSGSRIPLVLIFLVLVGGGILGGVLLMQNQENPPLQTLSSAVDVPPVTTSEVTAEPSAAVPTATEIPSVAVREASPQMPTSSEVAGPDPVEIAEEVVLSTREATAALKDTANTLRDTADALKNKVIFSSQAAIKMSANNEKKSIPVASNPPPLIPVAVAKPLPVMTPVTGSATARASGASRTPGWYVSQDDELAVPKLKVSEIHWQPTAKDRLAVVNNLPVLEGVDIEGARVDRIFKDRIRFVVNGRYLEVKVNTEPLH